MIDMNWKENFEEGKELVLVTSSNCGKPNANIVISLGFVDNKLMIADCYMFTTINNLKENPRICVVGGYFKTVGTAEILNSGKVFDKAVDIVASQDETLKIKNIILVNIEEVFDLNK